MKNFIKKYSGSLVAGTIAVAGITSAAVTPIGTLPNAVSGNVIKASDINDMAAAIKVLDTRTNVGDLATVDLLPTVPTYIDHPDIQTAAENATAGSTIFFKGKEYRVVESDKGTGKLWLDRNLGASEACKSATDPLCFGDLYQWGRAKDGHEYITVTSSVTGQADTITPNDAVFRKGSGDWSTADADGSARTAFLEKTDGTGVCPKGWKVPSEAELAAEQDGLKAGNSHFLNIPLAGYRVYDSASMNNQGRSGHLWSSTADANKARGMYVTADDSGQYTYQRGVGFSLRCVKK